jgi:hypothetical protein
VTLPDRQIDCLRSFAALVGFSFERNLLAIFQSRQAGSLDRGDVDENVFASVFRRNEAKTFGVIEKFNCAGLRHCRLLCPSPIVARPILRTSGNLLEEKKHLYVASGLCRHLFCDIPLTLGQIWTQYSTLRAGNFPKLKFVHYFRYFGKRIFFVSYSAAEKKSATESRCAFNPDRAEFCRR